MDALIAYWPRTGDTEVVANAVAQGAEKAKKRAGVVHVADQSDVFTYDCIIFGCSAIGTEILGESEFEPFFIQAEGTLMNKKIALFDPYGWGSGEWIQSWGGRVGAAEANLFKNGLIINYTLDVNGLDAYEPLGEHFVNAQKRVQIIRSAFRCFRKPLIKSFLYSYLQAYSLTIEDWKGIQGKELIDKHASLC